MSQLRKLRFGKIKGFSLSHSSEEADLEFKPRCVVTPKLLSVWLLNSNFKAGWQLIARAHAWHARGIYSARKEIKVHSS